MISFREFDPWRAYHWDPSEGMKSNTLICGQTGSGKSRLAFAICNQFKRIGQTVIFDPVGVWRDSGLDYILKLQPGQSLRTLPILEPSTVIDMSRLTISEQAQILDQFSEWVWESRVDGGDYTPMLVVIEECQNFIKNLRSKTAENIFRLCMAGRNISVRMLYLTPRVNNIPTELVFLANQKYIGLSNEQNTLRKIRGMTNKHVAEMVKHLTVGQFFYCRSPGEPQLIQIPLYEPTSKPTQINTTGEGITVKELVGLGLASVPLLGVAWVLIQLLTFFY